MSAIDWTWLGHSEVQWTRHHAGEHNKASELILYNVYSTFPVAIAMPRLVFQFHLLPLSSSHVQAMQN